MLPNLSTLQFAQTKPSTYHTVTDLWTATDALSLQVKQVNTAAPPNAAPPPATSSEVLRGDAGQFRGFGSEGIGSLVFTLGDEVASRTPTRLRRYAPDFPTQGAAADYIAGHMARTYDQGPLARQGADVDALARAAVREACLEWKPGMDLAALVHDKVMQKLVGPGGGKLGDIAKAIVGDEARQVADLMAAQIRANGSTVAEVAEHMRNTPIDAPR
jgi:hypothetical protein